MRALRHFAPVAVMLASAPTALAEADAVRGVEVYRTCASCHALEPGLHLSGPSLGGLIGRAAGTAEGYVRYSPGLKETGFEWNATALDGWLANPAVMIPDTYMAFAGIDDAGARADLIAFLELVSSPEGRAAAVAEGLMPAAYIRAQSPQPIGDAPSHARVTAIRHCGDSYFITTEDGRETPYWEKNIRLKLDSADTGPPEGVAVILLSGMGGDRFSVILSNLADLTSRIQEQC